MARHGTARHGTAHRSTEQQSTSVSGAPEALVQSCPHFYEAVRTSPMPLGASQGSSLGSPVV
eukprot:2590099-Alexandrium_andersonii.AAC.1